MKPFFLFIMIFVLLSGCGLDQGVNRSYIISHSEKEATTADQD